MKAKKVYKLMNKAQTGYELMCIINAMIIAGYV